jgi:hypothetical protein
MSYFRHRRSPMCRFCWERGHTAINCPVAKEKAAAARQADPVTRSYKDEEAIELVERRKQVSSNRACSYCGQQEHNVRTCQVRPQDIADATLRLQEWRVKLKKVMAETGFGIGAIVQFNGYSSTHGYYDSSNGDGHMSMIRSFSPNVLTYWSFVWAGNNGVKSALIDRLHDSSYLNGYYLETPYWPLSIIQAMFSEAHVERYQRRGNRTIVISPSHAELEASFTSWDDCYKRVSIEFEGEGKKKPSRTDLLGGVIPNQ